MPSEPPKNIEQSKIKTDGGAIVNGDANRINSPTTVISVAGATGGDPQIAALYQKLHEEMAMGATCDAIFDQLEELIATSENEVIGLQSKLEAGQMQNQLEYAMEAKEKYVRNLTKYQFYQAGQHIHAILLNRLKSRFQGHVVPALKTISPDYKLQVAQSLVLDEMKQRLGENPLFLQDIELDGMLFFLTGKCKLKWT